MTAPRRARYIPGHLSAGAIARTSQRRPPPEPRPNRGREHSIKWRPGGRPGGAFRPCPPRGLDDFVRSPTTEKRFSSSRRNRHWICTKGGGVRTPSRALRPAIFNHRTANDRGQNVRSHERSLGSELESTPACLRPAERRTAGLPAPFGQMPWSRSRSCPPLGRDARLRRQRARRQRAGGRSR